MTQRGAVELVSRGSEVYESECKDAMEVHPTVHDSD